MCSFCLIMFQWGRCFADCFLPSLCRENFWRAEWYWPGQGHMVSLSADLQEHLSPWSLESINSLLVKNWINDWARSLCGKRHGELKPLEPVRRLVLLHHVLLPWGAAQGPPPGWAGLTTSLSSASVCIAVYLGDICLFLCFLFGQ